MENVEEAIQENIGEILILVHQNASAIVSVKHEDYKEVLEHSLKWFEANEHYEQCGKIKKLLDNMNTKKPKVKKVNIEVE